MTAASPRRRGWLRDGARLGEEGLHELRALGERAPAWLRETHPENRVPVVMAIVAAVALQVVLPAKYGIRPRWMLPAAEVAFLVVLTALNPVRLARETTAGKVVSLALIAAMSLDNAASALSLNYDIVSGKAADDASGLLRSGAAIYLTNIIVFGLWYWETDRGGPFQRRRGSAQGVDFLFPQMVTPELSPPDWEPRFLDYLYVSYTNATAFSPTDTMPLSRSAKSLMAAQSAIALVTVGLVIARAVNVLR